MTRSIQAILGLLFCELALLFLATLAAGAESKPVDQLLKDKAGVEASIAALTKTFTDEKAEFDKQPATKAHMEKVAAATKAMNEEFDKTPTAAAYVKKQSELRVKFAEANQRLQQIKDQIVEAVSKGK
jgi:hypothetical protein